jgi:hypothetical protein
MAIRHECQCEVSSLSPPLPPRVSRCERRILS